MDNSHAQRVRSDVVGGAGNCLLCWGYKLVRLILINEYRIDEQERILLESNFGRFLVKFGSHFELYGFRAARDERSSNRWSNPIRCHFFTNWRFLISSASVLVCLSSIQGRDGLSFGYLLSKFSKVVWFAPYKRA